MTKTFNPFGSVWTLYFCKWQPIYQLYQWHTSLPFEYKHSTIQLLCKVNFKCSVLIKKKLEKFSINTQLQWENQSLQILPG